VNGSRRLRESYAIRSRKSLGSCLPIVEPAATGSGRESDCREDFPGHRRLPTCELAAQQNRVFVLIGVKLPREHELFRPAHFIHLLRLSLPRANVGSRRLERIPMIARTTSNSIKVKAPVLRFVLSFIVATVVVRRLFLLLSVCYLLAALCANRRQLSANCRKQSTRRFGKVRRCK
jgi:hypothetical protein